MVHIRNWSLLGHIDVCNFQSTKYSKQAKIIYGVMIVYLSSILLVGYITRKEYNVKRFC